MVGEAMTETQIGTWAVIGLAGLTLTCWLWMRGGRSKKWIRRYVAGAVISTTVIILCLAMNKYSPWLLVLYVTTTVAATTSVNS